LTYQNLSVKILSLLQEDGRQSVRELADKLGVSATTIGKRLEQLEADGVLRGITADLDYEKLGYAYLAVTRLKVQGDAFSEVLAMLEKYPELNEIYEITGDYDILVIGHYRDRNEMNSIIKEIQRENAILETNTSIVLNTVRNNRSLPLE